MQSNKILAWRDGLAINLLSNAIGLIVGGSVAYLKHEGSSWVAPLLLGAVAWFLTIGIWALVRLFRNVPVQTKITDRNLQPILRGWLDDIGLRVQSIKDDKTHFTFLVTTDGGRAIAILRHKDSFPEYLTFRAYYKEEAQNKAFSDFTNMEQAEIRLTLQLELAHAVMGYVSPDILCDFTLFKRIPITPSLSIDEVSKTLWEVEAALASVFFAGARILARKKNKEA